MPDDRRPDDRPPDTPVLHERRGPVAYVTMNRPRYRNAQNSAMTYALDDAFHRAAEDPEVKVAVPAGAGEDFSAGHDIGTPGRGACVAGGLMPARVRDLIVASEDAFFADPVVRMGIPGVEYFAHPWAMAPRIAAMPAFGPALTKRAVNQAEDLQDLHTGMDSVFGLHHLAHAHNAETAADSLGGVNVAALKEANT
ncbi:enoyl-CoA hydratase-related protein [Streptomyces nojiriensis]|uniref:enoyl-CoA hydratase-related protein n=1 Tax=Streptomyces nojiriensis TaxID=66374 RepID=UPI0036658B53